MPDFRIHFEDRPQLVLHAATPEAARKIALKREPGASIRKIKIDRVVPGARGTRRLTRKDFA